jgi:5-methylcytosine-specific restriction endonuclease McrBC regulatory subunit McrC
MFGGNWLAIGVTRGVVRVNRLDDIVCYELGSNAAPWSGSAESLGQDADAMRDFVARGLLQVDSIGNKVLIGGADRVGLLLLPSGRRVVIRSKVPSLTILEWLAFLGEFPPLEIWLRDPTVTTGADLYGCVARLFIRELEIVTRRFLRKDFTLIKHSSSTLRGKLLMTPLCRAMHRLPEVPQLHRTPTLDTAYNTVVALALDKCFMLLGEDALAERTAMAHLTDSWANVSRDISDVVSAVTEAQWASPPGYRAALQLARLILIGAALDPSSGAGGQAFTLSLAIIWENSLRKLFEKLEDATGWTLVPDSGRTRQWDDPVGQTDKNRWMTTDVMVEQDSIRWVLDAKYKRGYGDEARNDRFQMCAYAVGFSADRVTLVYPTATDSPANRRLLLRTMVGGQPVTVDSVELPMARGPCECLEALQSLCKCNDSCESQAVLD